MLAWAGAVGAVGGNSSADAMMLVWGCAWVVAAATDTHGERFLSARCHDSRFGLYFERQHRRLTVMLSPGTGGVLGSHCRG